MLKQSTGNEESWSVCSAAILRNLMLLIRNIHFHSRSVSPRIRGHFAVLRPNCEGPMGFHNPVPRVRDRT